MARKAYLPLLAKILAFLASTGLAVSPNQQKLPQAVAPIHLPKDISVAKVKDQLLEQRLTSILYHFSTDILNQVSVAQSVSASDC